MFRSRSSRFGSSSSANISRSFSARILCGGDAFGSMVDSDALKSSSDSFNSSKTKKLSPIQKLEEDLKLTKQKLSNAESEKKRALDQLRRANEEAYLANLRANEALSFKKDGALLKEIENLKLWVSDTRDELKIKDRKIESLEAELVKAREIETEKDNDLDQMKEEARKFRVKERDMMALVSCNNKRIQELESELVRKKLSESKMLELLVNQSNELDARICELEESKIKASLLLSTIESLRESFKRSGPVSDLQTTEDDLIRARENETKALSEVENLHREMESLRYELKVSVEAEQKSLKALEDLTWALNEVSAESKQAQKNSMVAKAELEQVKVEAKKVKFAMLSNDEKYKKMLQEALQMTEVYKNMVDRLRLEAEETVLAWNGKEMGFVSCIKRAEDERVIAQHEREKLAESLKSAEAMLETAREETDKLKDLLREAVNEANAAKASSQNRSGRQFVI